jgi:phosphoglycolate phosphatase
MKLTKAIIFDFDGVIGDTFEFHYNKVNEFIGINLTKAAFRDIHDGNFFATLPDEIKTVNWEEYRDYIYEEMVEIKMREEIKNLLLELNSNYQLFIVSSGGYRNIVDFFGNNNFHNNFKEILGQEFHRSKIEKFKYIFNKYYINSEECIFITDTVGDLIEAKKLDIETIGVTWGYHEKDRMLKYEFSSIVDNPYEIFNFIKSK